MYSIKQYLIKIRANTRPGWRQQTPKAIVVHYTANNGGTAMNHYNYFNNGAGGTYASAHYFVDKDNIVLIIPENEVAFHANETGYSKVPYLNGLWTPGINYKGNANSGSIGIEMCLEYNGTYHPETLKRTYWLINLLKSKYGLGDDRVIRHYDITGKYCPGGYIDERNWKSFKNNLAMKPVDPNIGKGSLGEIRVTKSTMTYKSNDGKQAVKSLAVGQQFYYYSADEYWTNIGSEWVPTGNIEFLTGPGVAPTKPVEPTKPIEEEEIMLDLNERQRKEMSEIFKQARLKGLFTSDKHEKAVLDGTMPVSQAIYLSTLIANGKREEK